MLPKITRADGVYDALTRRLEEQIGQLNLHVQQVDQQSVVTRELLQKLESNEVKQLLESVEKTPHAIGLVNSLNSIRRLYTEIVVASPATYAQFNVNRTCDAKTWLMSVPVESYNTLLGGQIARNVVYRGVDNPNLTQGGTQFILHEGEEILACAISVQNESESRISAKLEFPNSVGGRPPERADTFDLTIRSDLLPDENALGHAYIGVTMLLWKPPSSFVKEKANSATDSLTPSKPDSPIPSTTVPSTPPATPAPSAP